MYGTVARLRLKPGAEEEVRALFAGMTPPPGQLWRHLYRTDADPQVYYVAVAFESRDAYIANASRPEQRANFLRFSALLEGAPEWHDGEIVMSEVF